MWLSKNRPIIKSTAGKINQSRLREITRSQQQARETASSSGFLYLFIGDSGKNVSLNSTCLDTSLLRPNKIARYTFVKILYLLCREETTRSDQSLLRCG